MIPHTVPCNIVSCHIVWWHIVSWYSVWWYVITLQSSENVDYNTFSHLAICILISATFINDVPHLTHRKVIRIYLNGGNALKALPFDADARDVQDAVKTACGETSAVRVLRQCHQLFFSDVAFGLPSLGANVFICIVIDSQHVNLLNGLFCFTCKCFLLVCFVLFRAVPCSATHLPSRTLFAFRKVQSQFILNVKAVQINWTL